MTAVPDEAPLEVALDVSAVPARPAGAGRYVVELARALADRGDVGLTLLARRDDASRWEQLAPRGRVAAVVPSSRPTRLVYEQLRLGPVVASLTDPPVQVHHGPHYTMPRRSKVPCVVTVHDLTFFDHGEWHEQRKVAWFRAAIRRSAIHAAAIICVSETTAGRLQEVVSPACPVVVVPHGVDHSRFTTEEPSPGADREVLGRLGLERPYVLHLGTLEPRKGIADLVSAFGRVAGEQPGLELVLAGGEGWKGGPIMEAMAASPAAGRIRRLGYVSDSDVPALLRSARLVAYPSREEGFGLPALEALACGAPLVTTSGTSMAAIAGKSAVLVPPGEPAALARAIEALISGEGTSEAVERRNSGLDTAAKYTWAACAEAHLAVYRLAAGQGR
ncbi:MAG: glycosyltransferase family 1 protein [Acidimicrobiales bacterium]|jgi:glycosyltransferase involved in cell wall biosynthesis